MARIRMMPPFILPLLQNLHLPGQPRPFEQLTDSVCQKERRGAQRFVTPLKLVSHEHVTMNIRI